MTETPKRPTLADVAALMHEVEFKRQVAVRVAAVKHFRGSGD